MTPFFKHKGPRIVMGILGMRASIYAAAVGLTVYRGGQVYSLRMKSDSVLAASKGSNEKIKSTFQRVFSETIASLVILGSTYCAQRNLFSGRSLQWQVLGVVLSGISYKVCWNERLEIDELRNDKIRLLEEYNCLGGYPEGDVGLNKMRTDIQNEQNHEKFPSYGLYKKNLDALLKLTSHQEIKKWLDDFKKTIPVSLDRYPSDELESQLNNSSDISQNKQKAETWFLKSCIFMHNQKVSRICHSVIQYMPTHDLRFRLVEQVALVSVATFVGFLWERRT